MGEKGNVPDMAAAVVGAASDPSVIERVTTTTTETVLEVGDDVLSTVRDKVVDHGADALIDEARARARRSPEEPGRSPEHDNGLGGASGPRDG